MLFARLALRWNANRMQAALFGNLQPASFGTVGDDDGDFALGNSASSYRLRDGLKIRPTPAEQNADFLFRCHYINLIMEARSRRGIQIRLPVRLRVMHFALAADDAADDVSFFSRSVKNGLYFIEFFSLNLH